MTGRMMLAAAALVATAGVAQADETHPKHHHKGALAAEKATAPQDEPQLPEKVQRWFGNTVDDILTGADKTLNGEEKK